MRARARRGSGGFDGASLRDDRRMRSRARAPRGMRGCVVASDMRQFTAVRGMTDNDGFARARSWSGYASDGMRARARSMRVCATM